MIVNKCVPLKVRCNEAIKRESYHEFENKLHRQLHLPYLTSSEVVIHNSINDCWVSFLGVVRNLTPLIAEHRESPAIKPLLAFAGKDISDWFDTKTGDILHHVHPVTGVRVPYTPYGPIPDVGPNVPTSAWEPLGHTPWWFDTSLVVGLLTKNARQLRIMNVMTGVEATLQVCSEDSLERILERYLPYNTHAWSYTWKYEARVLDMNLTLDENGVPDLQPRLREAHLPDITYIPCLMLYYNDDLT